ncbi:hypothetical protein LIER_23677 [Lithospermum erythrorhizon]|uniref:Uncharacterized protein n=1 Tax=Lithospermum erythrorhizon TaxID=34254 RepID=A0AAV3R2C8_LITER
MTEDQEVPRVALSSPQTFTVTFTDEDLPQEDADLNRPLYLSGFICERKIGRMLVDVGAQSEWPKSFIEGSPTLDNRRTGNYSMVPCDRVLSHIECATGKTIDR